LLNSCDEMRFIWPVLQKGQSRRRFRRRQKIALPSEALCEKSYRACRRKFRRCSQLNDVEIVLQGCPCSSTAMMWPFLRLGLSAVNLMARAKMYVRRDQGRRVETDRRRSALPNREPHFLTRRESQRGSYRRSPTSLQPATLAGTDVPPTSGATQAALKKPQRPRKNTASSYRRIRQGITWAIGGCVAALSFVAVLWLTGPIPAPLAPGIMILTNAAVSDATSLMAAVRTAGLRGTEDVKGAIEEIRRLDNDRVAIKGWATDTTASGSALTVVAFAGGRHVLTTVTNGARVDIAKMLGLADASQANMAFQGAFGCRAGEKVIVVAVTSGAAYSQFRSLACP
jgi:hypothetical protein